jgi:hypothetical protein
MRFCPVILPTRADRSSVSQKNFIPARPNRAHLDTAAIFRAPSNRVAEKTFPFEKKPLAFLKPLFQTARHNSQDKLGADREKYR